MVSSFLPCPSEALSPRAPLSFFVFSLFPLPLFPSDQRPASHCVPAPGPISFLPFSTYSPTAPTLSLASTNSHRRYSYHPQRSLFFAPACPSVDICGSAQLIALSDLHLTRSTGYHPWIIHVIDVWTRSPLFLAICSQTLLTLSLSVFANHWHFIGRNLTFAWPSLHHLNRNFSSIASSVRLLQQAFVFAPVARPDLKNLYRDPTLVPLLIHYPLPPHPTIAPPKPPYHPPLLNQARLPHPVQLHDTRE